MFTSESGLSGRFSAAVVRRGGLRAMPLFRRNKKGKVVARAMWTRRMHVGVRPSGFFKRAVMGTPGGVILSEGDYDGTLGKRFRIKKVFKKVVKTAGKLAAAPTAAGLQAVGLKKYSGKLGKAVGYTKGEMNAIRSAGKGIQYAAAATGAVMLAPAAGAAFGAIGKGALVAGKAVGGKLLVGGKMVGGKVFAGGKLLKKGMGLFGGLLKKAPKTVEEAAAMSEEVAQAAQNAGLINQAAPEQTPAPQSPFAPSPEGSGGGSGAEGATPSGEMTTADVSGFPGKIPPVMLIAAVAAVALSLPKFAKARR